MIKMTGVINSRVWCAQMEQIETIQTTNDRPNEREVCIRILIDRINAQVQLLSTVAIKSAHIL